MSQEIGDPMIKITPINENKNSFFQSKFLEKNKEGQALLVDKHSHDNKKENRNQ
jgi:hypothetical protein